MAQRHGRDMQHQKGYSWFFLHMSSSWVTGLISTVLIVGTGGFFYAWYYQFSNDIAPDSVAGYVYAIAGTCCTLLATVLYTIHRRSRKRLMGQLNAALNWHIFFAIMGIAFIFMHSFGNFNAKTGTYALYSLIALIISGFVGRALDRIMPWLIAHEVDKILTAEGEDRVESISRNLQFQAETRTHPRPTPDPPKTPPRLTARVNPTISDHPSSHHPSAARAMRSFATCIVGLTLAVNLALPRWISSFRRGSIWWRYGK